MLEVSVITNNQDFEGLRSAWDELLKDSSSNNVFLSFDWMFTWWQVFETKNRELTIIVMKNDGNLVAIAPFYIEQSFFRVLKILSSGYPISPDYLNVIIRKGYEDPATNLILKELSKLSWDYIFLSDIARDSSILSSIKNNSPDTLGLLYERPAAECHIIVLPESYDLYFKQLSKKQRQKIRTSANKLNREYPDHQFSECQPEEFPEALVKLSNLSAKRWKDKKVMHSSIDRSYIEFHQQFFNAMINQRIPRIFKLKFNNQIVAINYLFQYDNTLFYYQSGFDEQFSPNSPGLLLLNHIIKQAIMEKIKCFDFLKGAHGYKDDWSNASNHTVNVFWFRKSAKGQLAYYRKLVLPKKKHMIMNIMRARNAD